MFGCILHSVIHQNQDQLTNLLFIRIDLRTFRQFLHDGNILLFGKGTHNTHSLLCSGDEIHPYRFYLICLRVAARDSEEVTDELCHLLHLVAHVLDDLLQKG